MSKGFKINSFFLVPLTLILTVGFGVIDLVLFKGLHLHFIYLLPLFLASFYGGFIGGFLQSILIAAVWMADEILPTNFSEWQLILQPLTLSLSFLFLEFIALGITLGRKFSKKTSQKSHLDLLTGTLNSQGFQLTSKVVLELAHRNKKPISFVMIQIDNIRGLNNDIGFSKTDEVLAQLSGIFMGILRKSDLITRMAGNEFGLLLPETTFDQSELVLNRLNKTVSDHLFAGKKLTLSMGAVSYISAPSSIDDFLKLSSNLLASAKKSGGDKILHSLH